MCRDIQNYMVWRFVMNLVVGLSRKYRETRKAFRKVRSKENIQTVNYRHTFIHIFNLATIPLRLSMGPPLNQQYGDSVPSM